MSALHLTPHRPSTSSPTEAPVKKNQRRQLTPKSLFQGLARELDLLAPEYACLHLEHPALQPYPTLAALMERLTKGPRDQAKNELLAALIVIRKRTPHRLWVALLLRAFRPMLRKLWKKLFGSDAQERFALLLISFQGAICHLDPWRDPTRVGMYVRQATRRRAIAALTKELRWNDVGFGQDAEELVDARSFDPPLRHRLQEAKSLLRPGELLAHVRRTHPTLSAKEQMRIYQKLRYGLHRVFMEVAPTDGGRGKEVVL